MKQLLITLVAVVLGITAMSSYAEGDRKAKGDNKFHPAQPYLESDSRVYEYEIFMIFRGYIKQQ